MRKKRTKIKTVIKADPDRQPDLDTGPGGPGYEDVSE